jgi:acyl dehydratase
MPSFHFEDFPVGSCMSYANSYHATREELLAFSREYDPQGFHIDEEAAKASFVGELIGSGWHTCAILMRMFADAFILDTASMGSPGVEEVKWLKPVRPGDVLSGSHEVVETRTSRSRPEMGLARFRFTLHNQKAEPVIEQVNWIMIGRRHPGEPAPAPAGQLPKPEKAEAPAATRPEPTGGVELGRYTFTQDDIIRFAKRWDPQVFHTDPDAARHSAFGALCASGWHTGAIWMKLMVAWRERDEAATRARGERVRRLGPSPGFRDLRWLKPVFVGDTLTYASRVVEERPSRSRPGWSLVFQDNTATNQRGELVFSFRGCVFRESAAGG